MLILVTFAVDVEFSPWRKRRKFRRVSDSGFASTLGGESDHEVVVLLTGIGAAAAEAAIARSAYFASARPDVLISSGFAGALKTQFAPGTIVAPAKTRTLKDHANVDSDVAVREEAIRLGAAPIDSLITLDRLVKTAEEKEKLAFFGEAIDMESAVVMSRFASAQVPAAALRVISDGASEDLPVDFDRCLTPQGGIRPMSLVNQLVRRPGNLPNLVRFARQSYDAAQKLGDFLEKLVISLAATYARPAKA
jgi:adenosylhomocysteine nucleosidase